MSLCVLLLTLVAGTDELSVEAITSRGQPRIVSDSEVTEFAPPRYTLAGDSISGRLRTLSDDVLTIDSKSGSVSVPRSRLFQVRFPSSASETVSGPAPAHVVLVDGSQINCESVETVSGQARLATQGIGEITLAAAAIRSIRLQTETPELDSDWEALCKRQFGSDALVVRRQGEHGPVLDRLNGVVGDIRDGTLHFLLDNESVPVKLSKVFGVLFHRQSASDDGGVCQVRLTSGDVILAKSISGDANRLETKLKDGLTVAIPTSLVQVLDFTASNVCHLSAMEPRRVQYTPYFDITWEYRRDANLDGDPLRLQNHTFSRGLCIHSRTVLQYALSSGDQRFWAVLGIDQAVRPHGNLHIAISGDHRVLLEKDVRGTDDPEIVDLDVSNVRILQILVDFGGDLDIADHLDLADAKVVR